MKSSTLAKVKVPKGIDAAKHSMQATERYRVIDGAVSHAKRSHLRSSHNPMLSAGELRETLIRRGASFP